jgi:hypothetical protein
MTDRDKMLSELRQSAGGIDPVLDQAESYGRAVKEVQKTTRAQGEVMSLALDNNFNLYHTNKKLVAENRGLKSQNRALELATTELRRRLEEIESRFGEAGGDGYKALWLHAQRTMEGWLHDALTPEALAEKLAAMKQQAAEIAALPERVTEAELVEMEVIVPPKN